MLFSLFRDIVDHIGEIDVLEVDYLEKVVAKAEIYAMIEAYRRILKALDNYGEEAIPKAALTFALRNEIEWLEATLYDLTDTVPLDTAMKLVKQLKEAKDKETAKAKVKQ